MAAKTTRIIQKQQEAAWKSVRLPGRMTLHVIRKQNLLDEDGVDAFSTKSKSSKSVKSLKTKEQKEAEEEFYPSDDDQTWSGHSNREYTRDEDFINEELDERTFMQLLMGKKIENYSSEEDATTDSDESGGSDEISLAENEVKLYDGSDADDDDEEESKDHVNDYFFNKKQEIQETAFFGGKIKFKRGMKAQRKYMKEQRALILAAQKRREKAEKKKRQKDKPKNNESKLPTLRQATLGDITDLMSQKDLFEGEDANDLPTSMKRLDVDTGIELAAFRGRASSARGFDVVDPFEVERKDAAQRRKENRKRKKEKLEEERKQTDEPKQKTNNEKLESIWNGPEESDDDEKEEKKDMDEDELIDESEFDEDDGIPVNELLDDEGASFIQGSMINTMDAIFDIAFGALDVDADDDDDDENDIIMIDFVERTRPQKLISGTMSTRTADAFHLVLGSDMNDEDAARALKQGYSPATTQVMQDMPSDMALNEPATSPIFDAGDIEEAMDMDMEIVQEEEEESELRLKPGDASTPM